MQLKFDDIKKKQEQTISGMKIHIESFVDIIASELKGEKPSRQLDSPVKKSQNESQFNYIQVNKTNIIDELQDNFQKQQNEDD